MALFTPRALTDHEPRSLQTWHLFLRRGLIQAWCEWPKVQREYRLEDFTGDSRLDPLRDRAS